jgi:superfamily II DNA/RNA helicase
MFSIEELVTVVKSPAFTQDLALVRVSLARNRLGQGELFRIEAAQRLQYFVECVLTSAPRWTNGQSSAITTIAGEVAEALALRAQSSPEMTRRMRVRSALLFELAGLPAISSAMLQAADLISPLREFFNREKLFAGLQADNSQKPPELNGEVPTHIAESALASDVFSVGQFVQGFSDTSTTRAADFFFNLASELRLDLTATELQAFSAIVKRRANAATRVNVDRNLFESLRKISFPTELWSSQSAAIHGGLIDSKYDSWGLAAPTGTGKSFVARLLIVDALSKSSGKKVLYIVPSRALVYEVSSRLSEALAPLGIEVMAVTPQLVELQKDENKKAEDSSVLVLTPEKADMLLRLGSDFFANLCLVVVDEAHHIESSSRGILLEMYLWRLKQVVPRKSVRFVFLSAVTPNIGEIAAWMGNSPGALVVEQRPTRMRAGVFRIKGKGRGRSGWIDYADGTSIPVFTNDLKSGDKNQLVQLASELGRSGPVLVVAKGKRECEKLAKLLLDFRSSPDQPPKQFSENKTPEEIERLDSRLERELYPEVPMRGLLQGRIAYHHAGLPPRVRVALEDAIRRGFIDFVFATTTLAEGVNFPFSTVIVQSLALREPPEKGRPVRYHPITPRVFWNIAGRAGRPGYDKEGQVILFEPSLGLEKIRYVIGDYLNPNLSATEPVRSAYLEAIDEIAKGIESGDLASADLGDRILPLNASKRVQGAINLLRVSLIHARASGLDASPEEILEGSFAARFFDTRLKGVAQRVFSQQQKVVTEFLDDPASPSKEIAAELGLSIETLSELKDWVTGLQDWQIKNVQRLFHGGELNANQIRYFLAPVAARMAELEGPRLGGFLSDVIVFWISGAPFFSIRSGLESSTRYGRVEDLVSVVYSRIQYLLPWGLYAADCLLEVEAEKRKIQYDNQLMGMANLADAGVSSFDALRLVHLDFERTDATRLAREYRRRGGIGTGYEIVGWLATTSRVDIEKIVKGQDKRRLDYDLGRTISKLSSIGR